MNSFVRKVGSSLGWVGLLAFLAVVGCRHPDYQFPESDSADPDAAAVVVADPPARDRGVLSPDTLRLGDRIEIGFSGNSAAPGVPHREQIRDDGQIEPPLLGTNILAAGKTVGQLQNELHDLYVPAFFKSITVTVRLEERYFFVGGQVRSPGQKLYLSEMTVTKAIQAAGDFTDFANRKKVELIRKDGSRDVIDVRRALRRSEEDLPIYPGDMIHVPQRAF